METSRSPWKVMRDAHELGCQIWPAYAHRFSRHDFTLPQLFASLVVREMLKLSYRKTEALLRDSPHWLAQIGMRRAPDHNTLWRAFGLLLSSHKVNRMLDLMVRLFAQARLLHLSSKPLTMDATYYERHHRSRHYDRVCRRMHLSRPGAKYAETPGKTARSAAASAADRARSAAARRLPKLAVAVASSCHAVLAARVRIGHGSDAPDFKPLLYGACRRASVRTVGADAGYDSERNHCLARLDIGVRSVIPPKVGRRSSQAPAGRYRRLMRQRFARGADSRTYVHRAQSETVHSMMKRNFGEALRSVHDDRRQQEMLLRALAHNVMLRAGHT